MAAASLDPSDDSSLDLTRGAQPRAPVRADRGPARSGTPSPSSTETASETAVEQEIAADAEVSSSVPAQGAQKSNSKRPVRQLVLDVNAVADVDGLEQEVSVLRASIRHLASGDDDVDSHVKVLAELRHQIEALCRALKTQQALEGSDGGGRTAEMRRALEELGDDLGVAR